jgi:cell division protein FtsI (penicillin-binding protein 3)
MSYAPGAGLALRIPLWRTRVALVVLALAFIALLGRAFYLQGMHDGFLRQKGESRYSRVIEISATRGRVLDRNGEPLAISTPVKSVWAIPGDVELEGGKLKKLSALLELDPAEIRRRLSSDREFVFVKRQISPEVAERVEELAIPGLYQQREYRRYYPAGEVMAHVLGFTGIDDAGQEGIELAHQATLNGRQGSRRVIKDRLGHIVEDVESIKAPQEGQDVTLSIDGKIQYLAFRQLKAAVEAHKAKAGAIVVLDVQSGEILALANLPSFNPNNRGKLTGAQVRNRVLTDTFEPGSTLKPFTVALALETGKVTPDTVIDTGPGIMSIGSATIRDAHQGGRMTVAQVIQKSSNVGAAKIALSLSASDMWANFDRVGFGSVPDIAFPGAVTGRLRPYKSWRPIEQATMAYGHGISVSLIQLARAYTVFARDGQLVPVTLTKADGPPQTKFVMTAETARAVRSMLELAVQPGGTAPRAQIMGYRVAGKTGTAHKQENGGYALNRYVSSFVGLSPASNPRLIVAVMIDEPSDGQYYGGAVAAPVFAEVMAGALHSLAVPPDAPMQPIRLPSVDEPEIRENV